MLLAAFFCLYGFFTGVTLPFSSTWNFGPAALSLGTATVPVWPDPDYSIGVIAGTRSIDPVGWLMLPRPNDGRVSVARTGIPGLHGHLVRPVSHALMMNHPTVIAQTVRFLATGAFAA